MSKPKPKEGYKLFTRFCTVLNDELRKMSDRDLKDIQACGPTLTHTNCGWTEYGLREILPRMANAHALHREILAAPQVSEVKEGE